MIELEWGSNLALIISNSSIPSTSLHLVKSLFGDILKNFEAPGKKFILGLRVLRRFLKLPKNIP